MGNKPAVKVHLVLSVIEDGQERELCSGTGIFKKLGALRAL